MTPRPTQPGIFVVALTPAEAVPYFQSFADVGIQYFIVETLDATDVETIRLLAEEVVPHVRARRATAT